MRRQLKNWANLGLQYENGSSNWDLAFDFRAVEQPPSMSMKLKKSEIPFSL